MNLLCELETLKKPMGLKSIGFFKLTPVLALFLLGLWASDIRRAAPGLRTWALMGPIASDFLLRPSIRLLHSSALFGTPLHNGLAILFCCRLPLFLSLHHIFSAGIAAIWFLLSFNLSLPLLLSRSRYHLITLALAAFNRWLGWLCILLFIQPLFCAHYFIVFLNLPLAVSHLRRTILCTFY